MKGTIVCCLRDMVVEKFGKEAWENALVASGLPKNTVILATEDVADEAAITVVGNLCKGLNITVDQAADAFGDFWMNSYAPRIYKNYFNDAHSAKEFLLKMDDVHIMVTKTIKNANPPRFTYEWTDPNTLLMTYNSKRNLVPFFKGLVKGVGSHYHEKLHISMRTPNQMEIKFPA